MSISRWIAILALGCLMIAVAYLPPEPREEQYIPLSLTSTEEARLDRVNAARQRTEDLLAALRFRDSVRLMLRANSARLQDAAVVIKGSVPADRQQAIRRTVEQVWGEAHGVDGSRLLVFLNVQPRLRRYTVEYVLPEALDHRRCVVAITVDPTIEWVRSRSVLRTGDLVSVLKESLGPCLFYAAFGEPGPHIADWLEQRSYRFANSADWTKPPDVTSRWDEPGVWNVMVFNMSFDAVACVAGRAARCRPVVVDQPGQDRYYFRPVRPAARITGVIKRQEWGGYLPGGNSYLASLVREMGRDRFGQFWRSPAPVDSAFRTAFARPIEQWTASWARALMPLLPPFGPAPRFMSVLLAVAAAGIAVTLAAAAVTRRQVG